MSLSSDAWNSVNRRISTLEALVRRTDLVTEQGFGGYDEETR